VGGPWTVQDVLAGAVMRALKQTAKYVASPPIADRVVGHHVRSGDVAAAVERLKAKSGGSLRYRQCTLPWLLENDLGRTR